MIYIEMKRIQITIGIINDTFWQMENWIFLHVTPINFFSISQMSIFLRDFSHLTRTHLTIGEKFSQNLPKS